MLARYAVSGSPVEQNTSLALALLTVALQGLLSMIFAFGLRFDSALRSVAVGTGLVLLVMMLSFGWGVAYVRPFDPRELLVEDGTAIEVRDLVQTLHDASWRETGLPQMLPFKLEAESDSVLAWYLRDFTNREAVGKGDEIKAASILVTTHIEVSNEIGERVGQDFALHRSWGLSNVACSWEWPPQCRSFIGWWLYRTTPMWPVIDQYAVLWVMKK